MEKMADFLIMSNAHLNPDVNAIDRKKIIIIHRNTRNIFQPFFCCFFDDIFFCDERFDAVKLDIILWIQNM